MKMEEKAQLLYSFLDKAIAEQKMIVDLKKRAVINKKWNEKISQMEIQKLRKELNLE